MIETPQIVQSEPILMAAIHLTVPRTEIRNVMGPGIQEVMAVVAAQGLTPTGVWFTHHFKMEPATFDFEICIPVATPVTASGRVKPSQLPARKVARTIYHGGYEELGAAWGEFEAWIAANGHTKAEDLWERYLVGPETGPDGSAYRTELNRPIL